MLCQSSLKSLSMKSINECCICFPSSMKGINNFLASFSVISTEPVLLVEYSKLEATISNKALYSLAVILLFKARGVCRGEDCIRTLACCHVLPSLLLMWVNVCASRCADSNKAVHDRNSLADVFMSFV